jgi:hypothetical protein
MQKEQTTNSTQDVIADQLLWPLWRCVSDDYKTKYKKDVWEHFENAVKSAAYTGSLKVFISNFQKRLPIDLQAKYAKGIVELSESGNDDEILNLLRTETTYLVMLIRLRNQDRKDSYEEHVLSQAEIDTLPNLNNPKNPNILL